MLLLREIYFCMSSLSCCEISFPFKFISITVTFLFKRFIKHSPPFSFMPTKFRSRAVMDLLLYKPLAMRLIPSSPTALWSSVSVSRLLFSPRASPMATQPAVVTAAFEDRLRVSMSILDLISCVSDPAPSSPKPQSVRSSSRKPFERPSFCESPT